MNSSLPGGVQAILKEKKGDLESAAKILLQEFQKSGGVDEQLATLNDFLEFTNRQSQNLTQGDFFEIFKGGGSENYSDKRNELFLPLFDLFNKLPMSSMKLILPQESVISTTSGTTSGSSEATLVITEKGSYRFDW